MNSPIRIFIGTCVRNIQAEIALEYSIRKNTNADIEIVWMRDTPGSSQFHGWNKENWGTGFTPFRWVIPELCNFQGRAIYMDVDMLCLGDVQELWEMSIPHDKVLLSLPGNYSVMLIDCERFGMEIHTYNIDEWKKKSCKPAFEGLYNNYILQLEQNALVGELPKEWNSLDKMGKLIHYTGKKTQPWHPYPDRHDYVRHGNLELLKLWWDTYEEAMRIYLDETSV